MRTGSALEDIKQHEQGETHEDDQAESNQANNDMSLAAGEELGGRIDFELLLVVVEPIGAHGGLPGVDFGVALA